MFQPCHRNEKRQKLTSEINLSGIKWKHLKKTNAILTSSQITGSLIPIPGLIRPDLRAANWQRVPRFCHMRKKLQSPFVPGIQVPLAVETKTTG